MTQQLRELETRKSIISSRLNHTKVQFPERKTQIETIARTLNSKINMLRNAKLKIQQMPEH